METVLTAPSDGIVTHVLVEAGNQVDPGTPLVVVGAGDVVPGRNVDGSAGMSAPSNGSARPTPRSRPPTDRRSGSSCARWPMRSPTPRRSTRRVLAGRRPSAGRTDRRGEEQRRRGGPAHHRGLPVATRRHPRPTTPSVVAQVACRGRRGDRRDQPRPVRHRAGRHAQSPWRGAGFPSPRPHLGRIELGIRRRGRARSRRRRHRHRHRRVGSGARRAAGHRRHQADLRRRADRRSRPGLPVLRLRDGLRAGPRHRRRRDGRDGRAVRARSRPTRRWPRRRSRRWPCRANFPALSAQWRAAFRAACARLESHGAVLREIDLSPFLAAARLLYDGGLVAERHDAVGEFVDAHRDGGRSDCRRDHLGGGRRCPATRLLRDRRRLAELTEIAMARARRLRRAADPDHHRAPDDRRRRRRPGRRQLPARDLHQLLQPDGHVRGGGAVGHRGRRPVRRVGDRADPVPTPSPSTSPGWSRHRRRRSRCPARRRSRAGRSSRRGRRVAGADATALLVVGAHLRGQPLAFQLEDRGARWLGPAVHRAAVPAGAPGHHAAEAGSGPGRCRRRHRHRRGAVAGRHRDARRLPGHAARADVAGPGHARRRDRGRRASAARSTHGGPARTSPTTATGRPT